jgi:hypothetical protein
MECNGIIIYLMGYTEKKNMVYFEGDNLQHLKNG